MRINSEDGFVVSSLTSIGFAIGSAIGGFVGGGLAGAIVGGAIGGTIGAAAGYGVYGAALYFGAKALFGPKTPGQVSGPAGGNPKEQMAAAQEASAERAQAAQTKRAQAIKRSRTIFTTPLGLKSEADVMKKTLLGV